MASLLSSFSTPISTPSRNPLFLFPTKTSILTPPLLPRKILSPPLRVATPPTQQPLSQSQSLSDEEVDIHDNEENSPSKFTWRDHWYPVSLVEDLNPSVPTPFQLLNRDLVLWFDPSLSQWVAFDDKCPHRLAPLSVSSILLVLFLDISRVRDQCMHASTNVKNQFPEHLQFFPFFFSKFKYESGLSHIWKKRKMVKPKNREGFGSSLEMSF